MSKDPTNEECLELKNLKYQTMLLHKNTMGNPTEENILNMENFLSKERKQNTKKPWSKLEKAVKLKKLTEFVKFYTDKNKNKNKSELKQYLLQCLDRKKLQRTKDVIYDMDTGKIKQIPGLSFNKKRLKYTLKRVDKKGSTLKCLAPKRNKSKSKTKTKPKIKTKPKTKPKIKTKTKTKTKIDIHLKD